MWRAQREDGTGHAMLAMGCLGAPVLAALLLPVREITSASNLAFAFLAWTIVVAELGGRAAGLATATVSALSLNFFLTRPYLTLTIDHPDDIIAFVALAVCGVLAGLFGRRRQAVETAVDRARADLATARTVARALEDPVEASQRFGDAAAAVARAFGLRAVALRDRSGRTVAIAGADDGDMPSPPDTEIDLDTLLAEGERSRVTFGTRGLRLPDTGGRIILRHDRVPVGALDLWEGTEAGFDADQAAALSIIARLFAAELGRPTRGAEARHG